MLISDSMGFRMFFFFALFPLFMFVHCFMGDPANSLTVSMFKWDVASKNFLIRNNLSFDIFVIDLKWRLREKVKPAQATLYFFFYIQNELICSPHSPRRILSSTIAVDFLLSHITWVTFKHSQTETQISAHISACIMHISEALSFPLYSETFNSTEMDAKRFFGAFDVECCLSTSASIVKKNTHTKSFFYFSEKANIDSHEPTVEINYEFASLLSSALCACWQFITFPAVAFERYSYVRDDTCGTVAPTTISTLLFII